ncbi:hypothetical protein SAMN04515620_1772 [Collimonas sp. OK607]|uniref:hypothetical protein n=1 Tax=Collimonas sp. OK607 TaxID=1798194 RepID=UPI0008EAD5D8|nr:hypothetical protein [Collimonas sp. OK607]SFB41795.1 hypothetical protein SAMN04515620_1772 [Collimonas sp. OK607]
MTNEKFLVDHLISTSGKKSNTTKLSEILDQVEQAISNGVSYAEIVQEIEKQGIMKISIASFRLALHRIRKKRIHDKGVHATLQLAKDSADITNPTINLNESAKASISSNAKMTLQEIQDQDPRLTSADRRARFSDQYIQEPMHPRIQQLLEKNK